MAGIMMKRGSDVGEITPDTLYKVTPGATGDYIMLTESQITDDGSVVSINGDVALTGDLTLQGAVVSPSVVAMGPEKVVNGSFDTDFSSWSLGDGWGYDDVGHALEKYGNGVVPTTQDVSAVAGETYRVTYTLSNFLAGNVTVSVGGVAGTQRTTNGTFVDTIDAAGVGNLEITPSNTARLTVDDVSVRKIGAWTQAHIVDAAGGAVVDAEARTAIASIIDALEVFGIVARV
jgi:hypothetical protein